MSIESSTEPGKHSLRTRERRGTLGENVNRSFDRAMLKQFASPSKVIVFIGLELNGALILALGIKRMVQLFFYVSQQTMQVGTTRCRQKLHDESFCLGRSTGAVIGFS